MKTEDDLPDYIPYNSKIRNWDKPVNFKPLTNKTNMKTHKYKLTIYNGRVKVYVDNYVMFTFNQIDFKGYYSYKDDTDLYGIDIYLMNEKGGATTMEIYFKTKQHWLNILKLLDTHL